jgi:hypothetical protein
MQRRRSPPHTFEDNIAQENPATRYVLTYERVAFIARLADPDMNRSYLSSTTAFSKPSTSESADVVPTSDLV